MTAPKIKTPAVQQLQAPIEVNDATLTSARDEAIRRSKGKGYLGTILTGFRSGNGAPPTGAAPTVKQILG